jgi:alpha-1,2-mannosyltransferase
MGILYLVFTIGSAGMFHAATAFLPSTFAMYTTMLGMAAFMESRPERRIARAAFWFALGGLLGWPFSMAMCIPFVLGELFLGTFSRRLSITFVRFFEGGIIFLVVLVSQSL